MASDKDKSREELIAELSKLRSKVAEMELARKGPTETQWVPSSDFKMETLLNIATVVADKISHTEGISSVLDGMVKIADADGAVLREANKYGSLLRMVAISGLSHYGQSISDALAINSDNIWGSVYKSGESIVINDFTGGWQTSSDKSGTDAKAIVGLPIKHGGRVLGVVVISSRHANHFSSQRLSLMSVAASELGALMANAKLQKFVNEGSEALTKLNEQLRHRVNEIMALNHMFREHLKEQFTLVESYQVLRRRLSEIAEVTEDLASSQESRLVQTRLREFNRLLGDTVAMADAQVRPQLEPLVELDN